MKSKVILLAGLLATLANSTPLVYTFSGIVPGEGSGVIDDRVYSGLAWSNNVSYGEPFEYKILVDFDRPGNVIQSDGSVTLTEQAGNPAYTFFHAEYISGDLFPDLFHGTYRIPGDSLASYTKPMYPTMDQFGVDILSSSVGLIYVAPSYWTNIHFHSTTEFGEAWKVGETFSIQELIQNPLFIEYGASFNANVVLTDISPMSVPEPNQLITFALGIIFAPVLFGKRCIFKNRNWIITLRTVDRSS
jgi:hypothetical protein